MASSLLRGYSTNFRITIEVASETGNPIVTRGKVITTFGFVGVEWSFLYGVGESVNGTRILHVTTAWVAEHMELGVSGTFGSLGDCKSCHRLKKCGSVDAGCQVTTSRFSINSSRFVPNEESESTKECGPGCVLE